MMGGNYKMQTLKNSIHYVAASKDEEILKNSSSGGIFSEIAYCIFKMNGVVFGATFDSNEYKIVHTMVSCMEELSKIRKSKYVESDFKRVEPDIERNIDKNRYILFSGTPCQVEYIKRKYGYYDKLVTVDVFCHGVAESVYFKDYLKSLSSEILEIDFRTQSKERHNFEFDIIGKEKKKIEHCDYCDNIFTKLYIDSVVLRNSCFKCMFSQKQHISDITLDDFDFQEDAEKRGINVLHPSIVAINTERGEKIFDSIREKISYDILNDLEKIKFYYRDHKKIKGEWGYNIECKEKFIQELQKMDFLNAAYKCGFPDIYDLLIQLEQKMGESKKYLIYGAGVIAHRFEKAAKQLHPEWELQGNIVSDIKNKLKNSVVISVDEISLGCSYPIVVAVNATNRKQIVSELTKRGIYNYI